MRAYGFEETETEKINVDVLSTSNTQVDGILGAVDSVKTLDQLNSTITGAS
jgi:hypothetical protein